MEKKSIIQSSNFEEVVKSVLVSEEKKDKQLKPNSKNIVKEATGGAPGNLSVSRGSRGNMPPFSAYSDDQLQNRGAVDMMDIDSAQDSDAPSRAPYPLETVIDFISKSYQSLVSAEELIHGANKNPVLSEIQLKALKSIQDKIKSAMGNIKASVDMVRKISID